MVKVNGSTDYADYWWDADSYILMGTYPRAMSVGQSGTFIFLNGRLRLV